jgi:hypothetical protein
VITVETLRRWRPDAVESVTDLLRLERDRLLALEDELGGSRAPFGWSGTAALAWGGLHEEVSERLRRLVAGVEAALHASVQAADELRATLRALAEAERIAASHQLTVTAQGSVVDQRCVTGSDAAAVRREQAERERVRREISDRIEQVQRRATDIDLDLHDVLRRASADGVDDGPAVHPADAATAGHRPYGAILNVGVGKCTTLDIRSGCHLLPGATKPTPTPTPAG